MSTEENKPSRVSLKAEEKGKEVEEKKKQKRKRRGRVRLIPIWLRLIIVAGLLALSVVGGLMFGYGVIGSGTPADALEKETWQHILDILNGIEK